MFQLEEAKLEAGNVSISLSDVVIHNGSLYGRAGRVGPKKRAFLRLEEHKQQLETLLRDLRDELSFQTGELLQADGLDYTGAESYESSIMRLSKAILNTQDEYAYVVSTLSFLADEIQNSWDCREQKDLSVEELEANGGVLVRFVRETSADFLKRVLARSKMAENLVQQLRYEYDSLSLDLAEITRALTQIDR